MTYSSPSPPTTNSKSTILKYQITQGEFFHMMRSLSTRQAKQLCKGRIPTSFINENEQNVP